MSDKRYVIYVRIGGLVDGSKTGPHYDIVSGEQVTPLKDGTIIGKIELVETSPGESALVPFIPKGLSPEEERQATALMNDICTKIIKKYEGRSGT